MTFFELKKMIFENPNIQALFEKFRNSSTHAKSIFKMKFTRSFILYIKNCDLKIPISPIKLSNMLEKINTDNQIYNYLVDSY